MKTVNPSTLVEAVVDVTKVSSFKTEFVSWTLSTKEDPLTLDVPNGIGTPRSAFDALKDGTSIKMEFVCPWTETVKTSKPEDSVPAVSKDTFSKTESVFWTP